jgi:hypothetical protein
VILARVLADYVVVSKTVLNFFYQDASSILVIEICGLKYNLEHWKAGLFIRNFLLTLLRCIFVVNGRLDSGLTHAPLTTIPTS